MSAPISASGSRAGTWSLTPAAALVAVVLAATAVRLVAGALVPLTEDEAYYRLWSMRPAFGYLDHPPMIAWQVWLGRHVAGDNPLGVRLIPTLATAATSFIAFDVARLTGLGERVAARAGIWLNATLLVGFAGGLAVPDAPNALFWIATLWCAWRAMQKSGAWWLAAGVAAGLACLSKYSALFLAPGVLLWLALSVEGRRQLRTPWPWLAAVIAAAIFAPNVAWNAEHGWMTFAKQFGRARPDGFAPQFLGKLLIDQFVLLNPLIAVFIGVAIRRRAAWPLLAVSAPFAAYLAFHGLHDAVQGQWPAPLYPLLAIAAAAAAEDATGWFVAVRSAAAPVGLAVSAALLGFLIAPADAGLPFRDPLAPYRDWPAFSAALERERVAAGAAWVGAPTYGVAAQLAALPQLRAPATQIFQRERYTFETPGERADFTRPGLVVVPARNPAGALLPLCFAKVDALAPIGRGQGRSTAAYAVYRVAEPRRDVERQGCDPGALGRAGAPD
ncbi:MAG TPA: glycosyltransferase family 39 protein [Caulobacteraceae bacterium]|nr:glycosyltransferase family 39 protein [Caulobacteraceae bacterium]